ncbi:MAG: hypothetical protein A1D16_10985 [Flavihumibacter sp. CACIAM 22H1]|nr:MAG: hypothetical protein A1D16_10985 [Flavihumibacter sp. CACIAM 22H1]
MFGKPAPLYSTNIVVLKAENRVYYLIARKLSREASSQELAELEDLLKSNPELAYKANLYSEYFHHPVLNNPAYSHQKTQALGRLKTRLQQEFGEDSPISEQAPEPPVTEPTRWQYRWKIAAALLLITLSLAGFVYYYSASHTSLPPHSNNQYATMPGTRSKTVLPDGTIVWLNSESSIHYNADFGKSKREVTLIGEAFFDVTHMEDIPFIVHAKSVDILVKGTAFNVRSYPGTEKVQTSLLRGLVEVSGAALPGKKIRLHPNEKITIEVAESRQGSSSQKTTLQANQQKIAYSIDSLKESSLAAVIPEVAWIHNRLVFDNEPLEDVLEKMEKWYAVDIFLMNQKIAKKQVSGVLENENIEEALKALQLLNDFEYTITGREIRIK